jgi:protein gp37
MMAERSAIEWTDATWNPWVGCDQVSPGCAHCYADRWAQRTGRVFFGGLGRTTDATFYAPLKWKESRKVFVCSLSDFFHPDADLMRGDAWNLMRDAPQHTYLILTKRPELIAERLPPSPLWPMPNVWLGVSVENQRWADERIPILLDTPAAVRFLSCEPLLGAIRFPLPCRESVFWNGLHWIIVGGESGPKRRPMKLEWVREIRDQCLEACVPFFFKQWGGHTPKSGGRLLDGREWSESPEVLTT